MDSNYNLEDLYIKFQHCPPGKKLIDHYSELAGFEEFKKAPDDVIKIAILTGDLESPFVRIKNREDMLNEIFSFLGIDKSKSKNLYEGILHFKSLVYLNAWLKYMFIVNETEFTDYLLAKKDYEYFLQKSREQKPKDMDDDRYLQLRKKLREQISELGSEIRNLEARLFPDSRAAREAALIEAKNKIELYPEKYARSGGFE